MWAIFKLEFFKFIKNPWTLFFGIGFPIIWVFIDGYVWGKYNVTSYNIKVMNYVFPGLVILIATTFTINTISITLCSDRLEKRLKQLSLTKITINKYLFGLFLWNYILFLSDFIAIFLIAILLFNLKISLLSVWYLFLIPFFVFLMNFCFAIMLANNTGTTKNNQFITVFVFYIMIFLSKATIPAYLFPDWYKWVQILIPTGSGVLLLDYLFNGLSTSEIWYTYLIIIIYTIIFLFFAIKTFKWQ